MSLIIQRDKRLRHVSVGEGLPELDALSAEFARYTDVLLGRVEPDIDLGVATLLEVADAYFARASEIDILIHKAEREGSVLRGSDYYRFRTGELRAFLDMAKKAAEVGSRRITVEQMLIYATRDLNGISF
jgi:hypothetical protein